MMIADVERVQLMSVCQLMITDVGRMRLMMIAEVGCVYVFE